MNGKSWIISNTSDLMPYFPPRGSSSQLERIPSDTANRTLFSFILRNPKSSSWRSSILTRLTHGGSSVNSTILSSGPRFPTRKSISWKS